MQDERSAKRRAVASQKKELNTANIAQSLWLVKVPQFVAEAWADAEHNEVLGSLMVGVKPGREDVKQMIIKLDPNRINRSSSPSTSSSSSTTIPDQYMLEEMKSSAVAGGNTMLAFSTNSQTKQFAMEGTVTKSMVLKPPANSDYHSIVQRRSMQQLAERREVVMADPKDLERAARQSCTIEFLSSVRGELKRKVASSNGAALDVAMLKSKMFEAFEREPHQSFDAILTMCRDVPGFSREQELREVLEKYASYHHKGPHRGLWELRPQFRTHEGLATPDAGANGK